MFTVEYLRIGLITEHTCLVIKSVTVNKASRNVLIFSKIKYESYYYQAIKSIKILSKKLLQLAIYKTY